MYILYTKKIACIYIYSRLLHKTKALSCLPYEPMKVCISVKHNIILYSGKFEHTVSSQRLNSSTFPMVSLRQVRHLTCKLRSLLELLWIPFYSWDHWFCKIFKNNVFISSNSKSIYYLIVFFFGVL